MERFPRQIMDSLDLRWNSDQEELEYGKRSSDILVDSNRHMLYAMNFLDALSSCHFLHDTILPYYFSNNHFYSDSADELTEFLQDNRTANFI